MVPLAVCTRPLPQPRRGCRFPVTSAGRESDALELDDYASIDESHETGTALTSRV